MEKVAKKKKRRGWSRGTRLAAAGALFLVCLVLALYWNREPEDKPVKEDHSGVLTQMGQDEIADVTIVPRGEEAWTVERDGDGALSLAGESGWTVDETLGERMLDALANLEYEDILTENAQDWKDHPEEFGLAEPLVTAIVRTRDGELMTVRIGNAVETEEGSLYYMSVDNGDTLYAVSAGTVQDLRAERELLRPVEQPEILQALLDRITIRDSRGEIEREWRLRGNITDPEAGTDWLITAPFTYPADEESMTTLRTAAAGLRLGAWVGEATEENLEKCGLKEPEWTLELHMAAGSTGTVSEDGVYDVTEREERAETLAVGAERSELVRYVRFGDAVYTMSMIRLSTLLEAEAGETAARYVAPVPWGSLTGITVETAEGETEYARLSEEGEETRWLKNGQEISAEAMEAAYDRLSVVTVSGELPAGTAPGKTDIKYTFRTASGGTRQVELSDFDGMHDCVTLDGYTRFYLIKGGMTELP